MRSDGVGPTPGSLRMLLREDWERHARRWSMPGLQALAVYRFGAWQHARSDKRLKVSNRMLWLLYRVLFVLIRNLYGIELHPATPIGRRVRISHQHGITIHENARIGDDCHIHQLVTIGRGVRGPRGGAPRIGNHVELAPGAVLMGPITIGDRARIGPNAVVMTDVPAGAVVVARPARILQLEKGGQGR